MQNYHDVIKGMCKINMILSKNQKNVIYIIRYDLEHDHTNCNMTLFLKLQIVTFFLEY
jgi:hypothetical protein